MCFLALWWARSNQRLYRDKCATSARNAAFASTMGIKKNKKRPRLKRNSEHVCCVLSAVWRPRSHERLYRDKGATSARNAAVASNMRTKKRYENTNVVVCFSNLLCVLQIYLAFWRARSQQRLYRDKCATSARNAALRDLKSLLLP